MNLKNSLRQAEFLRPCQGLAILLPLRLAFEHPYEVTHSVNAPILSLRQLVLISACPHYLKVLGP